MNRTLAINATENIGQKITMSGWASSTRDHGGLIFIDLRDHTGIVQLTIHPENKEAFSVAEKIKDEFVITISGEVIKRADELVNQNIPTGTIEVIVESLEILNPSKPLPFPVMHQEDVINEDLRLRFRFLDLRRDKMQNMLRRRHEMIKDIRGYMDEHGFIEITTPILTSSSPEGARDFLVPSRLHPGKFYALPQAPQQFKQLLMVAGVPKYYQIAPCFRDEDPRADRSPGEFYQLDLEIAFAEKSDQVFQEMEPLFIELTEKFANKKVLQKPFPRIPYLEAMEKYGSDRPDLRFGMEMVDLSSDLEKTEFSVFGNAIKNSGVVKAICCPGGGKLTRSQIDELTEMVKKEGAGGLAYIVLENDGDEGGLVDVGAGEGHAAEFALCALVVRSDDPHHPAEEEDAALGFLVRDERADDGEDVAGDGALGLADDGEFSGWGGGDVGEPRDDAGDGLAGPDRALPDVDTAIGVGDAEALRLGRDRDGVGRDRQSGESSSGAGCDHTESTSPNRSASTVAGSFSGSGGACCRTARLASVVAAWRRAQSCELEPTATPSRTDARKRTDLSSSRARSAPPLFTMRPSRNTCTKSGFT
jgi:aspartyl/asparaginyl-tRNA synthetase